MFLVYTPGEGDDEHRWQYQPRKLMSVEREAIERATDRNFTQFTADVLAGNSRCRRALLWTFLRRDHRSLRLEDVDFAWDELKLEYSRQELQQMRAQLADRFAGADLDAAQAKLDEEISTAYDDQDAEGKAQLPVAD